MAGIIDRIPHLRAQGQRGRNLAVGVIIGAAFFSRIVSSLVEDVFMPVIGVVTGGLDFSNYFIALSSEVTATSLAAAREQGAVLAYGAFITRGDQLPHRRLGLCSWSSAAINRLRARPGARRSPLRRRRPPSPRFPPT